MLAPFEMPRRVVGAARSVVGQRTLGGFLAYTARKAPRVVDYRRLERWQLVITKWQRPSLSDSLVWIRASGRSARTMGLRKRTSVRDEPETRQTLCDADRPGNAF
jgi:hypothetical protein